VVPASNFFEPITKQEKEDRRREIANGMDEDSAKAGNYTVPPIKSRIIEPEELEIEPVKQPVGIFDTLINFLTGPTPIVTTPKAVIPLSIDSTLRVIKTGTKTTFISIFTPRSLGGKEIFGVRIPLFGRSYNISGVAGGEANLNSVGILNSDWGCGVIDSQFACSGSIPMKIGQETAISFRAVNFVGEIPKFIEANLYDAYDNKVLSIGIERTALIDE
jgi:hypothetical protein